MDEPWSPSWIVARTVPQLASERRAMMHAAQLSFPTYLPQYRQRIVVRGQRALCVRTLFPGYLFVFVSQMWHALCDLPGLIGLVMDGQRPARLAQCEIDALKSRHDAEGFVQLEAALEQFARGQSVRVQSGLFAGERGVYDGMSSRGREMLLLGALRVRTELAANTALVAENDLKRQDNEKTLTRTRKEAAAKSRAAPTTV